MPYGAWGDSYEADRQQYYNWNGGWGYMKFPPKHNPAANDVLDVGLFYVHGRWYNQDTGLFASPDEQGEYFYGSGNDAVNFGWYTGYWLGKCIRYGASPNQCWSGSPQSVNSNFWIARWRGNHRSEVTSAASRHNMPPEFLGAVLYLQQSSYRSDAQLNASSIFAGAAIGERINSSLNLNPLSDSGSQAAILIPILGEKRVFERDEGEGNIKPDLVARIEELGLLCDPLTGARANFPPSRQAGWGLSVNCWNMNWHIRANPSARFSAMLRLENPSWNLEYLAAHLDSARQSGDWPVYVPATNAGSEDVRRAMFVFHYNVDSFIGFTAPKSFPNSIWTRVRSYMPAISSCLL